MIDSIDVTDNKVECKFDCPICEESQEASIERPVKFEDSHTCSNCGNQYYLYALHDKTGYKYKEDEALPEGIIAQLESISLFHPVALDYHEDSITFAFTPKAAFFANAALGMGGISIILLSIGINSTLTTSTVTQFAYFLLVIGYFIGVVGIISGPMGSVFRAYKIYNDSDVDCTFTQFVYHSANYHRNEAI